MKKSKNSRNQGFYYYFCLVMEGSGSGARSVFVSVTNECGSGRPQNIGSVSGA
jgi:hypothetical protein